MKRMANDGRWRVLVFLVLWCVAWKASVFAQGGAPVPNAVLTGNSVVRSGTLTVSGSATFVVDGALSGTSKWPAARISGTLPPSLLPTITLNGFTKGTAAESGSITTTEGGQFAVFWIPLSRGDQWTDFELKASTDDFLADNNMVYFYHSPDPAKAVITSQVWTNRPDVYFTDSGKTGTPNRRAWVKQSSSQSIFAMLADANSEVGGFLLIVRDDLSPHRTGMVWSYNLMDSASADNDAAGRSVWRPIVPIRWTNDHNFTIN